MKIVAAQNTVVTRNTANTKTKSGLMLAEAEQKPQIGDIVSIGNPKKGELLPIEMEIGDTIVFRRYSDNRILIEGIEYNFIDFKDVVGVLQDE